MYTDSSMYLLFELIDPVFPIPHIAVYTFSVNNNDVVFAVAEVIKFVINLNRFFMKTLLTIC